MQKDFYSNEKESQVKRSWISTFSYIKLHNFHLRGNFYLVNLNSRHIKAQINTKRRIKARKKSVQSRRAIRTFDSDTHLTSRELLEVIKNKETHEFKNGILAQLKGYGTYVKEPFNRHKAKKVYASEAQIKASKYFVKLAMSEFRSLKKSKIQDLTPIRDSIIEKVFEKFRAHSEIKSIMGYIKSLWIVYDEHLYRLNDMEKKVDYHLDLLIKNTSQERIEKLQSEGKTPQEIYQILRTVQGINLYYIGILATRGGKQLKVYTEKMVNKLTRLLFNNFKITMRDIGVITEKDFFLIVRKHLSFLFKREYIRIYFQKRKIISTFSVGILLPCQLPSQRKEQGSKIPTGPPD